MSLIEHERVRGHLMIMKKNAPTWNLKKKKKKSENEKLEGSPVSI